MSAAEPTTQGERLAATLDRLIDQRVTDDRSSQRRDQQHGESAAGISSSTVNQILRASITCPPLRRLRGFRQGARHECGIACPECEAGWVRVRPEQQPGRLERTWIILSIASSPTRRPPGPKTIGLSSRASRRRSCRAWSRRRTRSPEPTPDPTTNEGQPEQQLDVDQTLERLGVIATPEAQRVIQNAVEQDRARSASPHRWPQGEQGQPVP